MEKIYNIKYIDAYYSYNKEIDDVKLCLHEAYGYVKKNKDNIIVVFIKKTSRKIKNIIKNNEKITAGLIIPDTALISMFNKFNNVSLLNNFNIGERLFVDWRDMVCIEDVARYDCSVMHTEGVLCKKENNYIVISNPDTVRIYPSTTLKHPIKKPNYYIIPMSLIIKVSTVK